MSGIDFNDIAQSMGKNVVRAAIDDAADPASFEDGTGGTSGTDADIALQVEPAAVSDGGTAGTEKACVSTSVPEECRPCWRVYDTWTVMEQTGIKMKPGVYFHVMTKGSKTEPPVPVEIWICGPLHVVAQTADVGGNAYGRLLRFLTTRGCWRQWAMPMHLLKGDGMELRGELLDMGLAIDHERRSMLAKFLQAEQPKRWLECATSLGWCKTAYVFPTEVMGSNSVVFQHEMRIGDECAVSGTLDGWRDDIARHAIDNPVLALSISVAFSGPLLAQCTMESGGIHLQGNSSCGKTTALCAATSVWGGPDYRRSWRATANGLEGTAVLHNDGLLALDELSECDPREVGAVVYMIGNGHGKQRASRSGAARVPARWRCAVLSTGEVTIGAAMADAGQRQKAGQSIRLLDVPAQREHGIYDSLGSFPSGAHLSDHLKRAASIHYGHPAREFVRRLTGDRTDHLEALAAVAGSGAFSHPGFDQQEVRAASRFALFAYAGELATRYGITGWPQGTATRAADKLFRAWRDWRGSGRSEHRQIIEAVMDYIERHGDSRFASASAPDLVVIRDRAGWMQDDSGGRTYLFTNGGLREATKGHDFKAALDVLESAGVLPPRQANGERRRSVRIGREALKLYPINAQALREAAR